VRAAAGARPTPFLPLPLSSGVNIKTRKRNIAVALDPGSFADAVVSIFADARAEGDAEGEKWLEAGLPGLQVRKEWGLGRRAPRDDGAAHHAPPLHPPPLQSSDLDFNRYGDTLFEVLLAGGRMSAGGQTVDDGKTLDRAYLSPAVDEGAVGPFVLAFQALLRWVGGGGWGVAGGRSAFTPRWGRGGYF